jgi:chorismate lyase/3-hydroxybenzoate synthase
MQWQLSDINNKTMNKPSSFAKQPLDIRLAENLTPPSPDHQLLMGFHFGNQPCEDTHPALVSLQLQPLDRSDLFEVWWYKGEVTYTRSGNARVAECEDYAVIIVEMEPVSADGMQEQSREAYRELLNATNATKHTRMVKIWNYFGEINFGEEDTEKYRQFSIGRAEVFNELGISDNEAPTGTAIGTKDGSGLKLIALASNHAFCPVENPRQVSAFHYPREYGPRSPKFSRGGFVSLDSHKLFLISGTASVVGHESNFPYDTELQTDETFRNLTGLCDAISELDSEDIKFELDKRSILRVYLRDPEDYQEAVQKIEQHFGIGHKNVAYLHGIVCRRELMIEIDGVKVAQNS